DDDAPVPTSFDELHGQIKAGLGLAVPRRRFDNGQRWLVEFVGDSFDFLLKRVWLSAESVNEPLTVDGSPAEPANRVQSLFGAADREPEMSVGIIDVACEREPRFI